MRIKNKAAMLIVRNRMEAETVVHEISAAMNNQRKINAQKDAKILEIEQNYAGLQDEINQYLKPRVSAVQVWAETHEEEFDKAKSINFGTALVGFRTGMPKLALLNREWNWDKVCTAVQRYLPNFIRERPEVDKEAIIGQRTELEPLLSKCGVKVVQGESFYIEPKLTEAETKIQETKEGK